MASFKSSKEILREFFVEQSFELYSANTRQRRSVLIELERDLQDAIGLPGRLRKLGLEEKEESKLSTDLPYVSPLLVYCSAIEVIARAYHKKEHPPKNKNGEWFKESAELFFDYPISLTKVLWRLRNSLSHHYSINGFVFTRGFSDSELPLAKVHGENGTHIVSTRKCLTSLRKARLKAYEAILNQSQEDIDRTAEYVSKHFIYYLVG
jgi:hypothetical protein